VVCVINAQLPVPMIGFDARIPHTLVRQVITRPLQPAFLYVSVYVDVVGGKCCKTDKVVKREICSIQTKGTKRLSFIDGDVTDSSSQFLLALCEKVGLLDMYTNSLYCIVIVCMFCCFSKLSIISVGFLCLC